MMRKPLFLSFSYKMHPLPSTLLRLSEHRHVPAMPQPIHESGNKRLRLRTVAFPGYNAGQGF
jgi:hypothetical protein